ncbi:MAG: two-component system sensor histidine kinase KdpD [Verrucomicrobiales bacterium]|nr:two-component system sensor histidine kinase KdpD [Verrucomicrobiales bacterium]
MAVSPFLLGALLFLTIIGCYIDCVDQSDRPNPDALLAAIQQDETRAKRGRLKVFIGMSPGVGKTFAMLEAAQRELKAGRDIVIGFVETHGRKETDALTTGLPTVPRKRMEYRGVNLTEMDVDAVLARKPDLAIIDEFAHSNSPGSRHPKRYQDVIELLDAGIDVYTTLNIQHVESRADSVRQITGATVHETIPDTTLERAEFELVDLPPDELRARLAAGKVYLPERVAAARDNFFRPGNLAALRELVLRFAAEHVGQDVLAFRRGLGISDPWKSGQRLLVALSPSPTSAALARWTCRLAGELHCPWIAVYVELPRQLGDEDQERLNKHLSLAKELGAEIITTTDADVVRGIIRVAREQNVTQLVVGKPAGWRLVELFRGGSLLNRLIRESGNIDIHVVRAGEPEPTARRTQLPKAGVFDSRSYMLAAGVVVLATVVNLILQRWIGYQSVSLIYLLSVILLGVFVGRGPTLSAAAVSAFLWNFFFTEPRYTFQINGAADTMMFVTYFVVALAMGQLTSRLRSQQEAEWRREQRSTALYLLTRELAKASDFADLLAIIIREVGKNFDCDVALSLPDETDPAPTPYFASTWMFDDKEQSVATWAWRHRQPSGKGTDTLPSANGLHLPLAAGERAMGVLSLRFHEKNPLPPAHRDLLDAYVRQIALVLDRQRLRDEEHEAKLVERSERLSKTLLDSLSHEMRTPIAAISSAAAGLAEAKQNASPEFQRGMIAEIREGAARLNRVIGNVIEMTRLESGYVKPKLDWCDLRDVIEVVVRDTQKELARHKITVSIRDNVPLVRIDFVLMQQALTNLVLNAAAHTPAGTVVQISANREKDVVSLSVADNGPGIPNEVLPHIFEKFYRAPNAATGGIGLGLSIVKGVAEAQGGTVRAENRASGGALFTIQMEATEPPAILAEAKA